MWDGFAGQTSTRKFVYLTCLSCACLRPDEKKVGSALDNTTRVEQHFTAITFPETYVHHALSTRGVHICSEQW